MISAAEPQSALIRTLFEHGGCSQLNSAHSVRAHCTHSYIEIKPITGRRNHSSFHFNTSKTVPCLFIQHHGYDQWTNSNHLVILYSTINTSSLFSHLVIKEAHGKYGKNPRDQSVTEVKQSEINFYSIFHYSRYLVYIVYIYIRKVCKTCTWIYPTKNTQEHRRGF